MENNVRRLEYIHIYISKYLHLYFRCILNKFDSILIFNIAVYIIQNHSSLLLRDRYR